MKQHALSAAFPAMSPADFDALAADIAANGQRDVIEVFEGAVLDGWHRERACAQLGLGPQRREFVGDPVSFVLSRNLHRRHLTASQRAMAEAACAQWKPHGGAQYRSAPGALRSEDAAAPAGKQAEKSLADLASDAGVSRRTMAQASKVAKTAVPEVVSAVTAGSLSVKRAAEIAALPEPEQAAAITEPVPLAKKPHRAAPPPEADAAALRATVARQAEWIDELSENVRELIGENDALAKVVEADDGLAEAMAENKRLRALLRTAEERISGLMFEKQEMTAEAKRLQRKIDKTKALEQSA